MNIRAAKLCLVLAATTLPAATALAQQILTFSELAPAMTSRQITPAVFVVGQVVQFDGTIGNLKPGSIVRVTSMSSTSSGCTFRPLGTLPSGTVASDKSYRFSVNGYFGPENATGNCAAEVKFSGTLPSGKATTPSFNLSFTPASPAVYVVSDTSRLASRFGYALTREHGTCAGTSNPGAHPVGMRTVGGDIMFNIRSGPAGTECTWTGKGSVLPNGMRLQSINVANEATGSCVGPFFTVGSFGSVSTTNPAMFGSITAGTNPNGAGAPIGVLNAPPIRLDCGNTLVNDKIVSVKLDTFTFVGPPGLTFP